MEFIHKIKDDADSASISTIEWAFNIDIDGGCEVYANDSIIFDIAKNGDIKIKVEDSDEQWVKIAKLVKYSGKNGGFTTDYKEKR